MVAAKPDRDRSTVPPLGWSATPGPTERTRSADLVSRSEVMAHLVTMAKQVAQVDATVLLRGESGAGKERIARLIHDHSPRAQGPFIAVNCGAISEALLESELFGHSRGAFTGAVQDRVGLFEAANGGSLLLDEVGEVSPGMQAKLLRVLQEREVRPVGESKSRPVDVRVLAATNRDLEARVEAGAFRPDLYYRLKVVELRIPALRERDDDILPLARLFLSEAALQARRPTPELSPEAATLLMAHQWPGNVRELANAMERAAIMARGNRVEVEDLPEELRRVPLPMTASRDGVRSLAEIEKEAILAALVRNGGNQTRAAAQLQIGTATLYRKLKSYGLIADKIRRPRS